jgi:hypothetical protein
MNTGLYLKATVDTMNSFTLTPKSNVVGAVTTLTVSFNPKS